VEEVEYLTGEGVDVIVTDHHKVRPPLPRAVALINPDAWEQLPQYASLAGVGVAFLLLIAVHIKLKDDPARRALLPPLKSCLDLVTLGTVADMVPLRGPSRTLVYHGQKLMDSRPPRPGIIALREVAGQADKRMDTSAIAFYLAPRINAAGRLGSAETGLELMMARSLAEAMPLARRLDKDNAQRREVEAAIFEEAQAMTEAILTRQDRHVIVLASPQWHKGVLGIVASKICEKFRKPSILLAIEDCTATGSGRSVPGFDLAAALDRCSEILLKYGGHSMAAGLTLEAARLDDLAERLELAAAELLPREAALPTLPIEAFVALRDVDHRMLQDLERLVPFGAGNPEPTIAVAGVTARRCQLVGGGDHLKFAVEQEGRTIEAIAFKLADKDVRAGDLIDVAFFPEINSWGGLSQIQLRVKDIRKPSQMAGRGEGRA
jgi:single-stranded-DNA-specific exonuclease